MTGRRWITGLCACVAFAAAVAQELTLDDYKKKYPGEDAVFLKKKEQARIFFEKDELKVESFHTEEMLVLTDKGVNYGGRELSEDYFTKILELKARSHVPDGKGYKKKDVTEFKKQTDVSSESFYDDGATTSFIFPSLVPGTRTEMTYKKMLNEPRFFGGAFFASYIPIEEFEFSIEVPKEVTVSYRMFNAEKTDIQFAKEEKKKTTIMTWKARSLARIRPENAAPALRYTEPHMVVYISDIKTKGGRDSVLLKDPAHLYSWYAQLVKDVNRNDDPALKKLADSLVAGETDEFEKVKKIFYWVQDRISYIAFEDGLGGFVPREAGFVCDKKFGDCKDMANLIYVMLRNAGIKGYRTWIGTRSIPYTYTEVPTPMVDNHMIATYIDKNGKPWFLDATGKNAPIDLYTSMIQGKEAMLGISETEHKIIRVPEVEKERNYTYDSIAIALENGALAGWGKLWTTGYPKATLMHAMRNLNQEKQRKFMKEFLEKGNNKFMVDSVQFTDEGREKGLSIGYRYKLPDYVLLNKDEIYVNMNLEKTFKGLLQNDPRRVAPVEFTYKETNHNVVKMAIPEGYKVTYMPPAVEVKNDLAAYKARYYQDDKTITLEYDYYLNTLLLPKEKFPEWNDVIKTIISSGNESIILKKQ